MSNRSTSAGSETDAPGRDTDTVNPMPTLLAIDGNSLLYRAYHAIPDTLTGPDGTPLNAVYGFASMLLRLAERNPDAAFVAWDSDTPSFRTELYPGYKATRDGPPESLIGQFRMARTVAGVLGYTQMNEPGFEADDLLATVAAKGAHAGYDTYLVTGDRDAFQLVADANGARGAVTVLYPKSGTSQMTHVTPAWVHEHYRVSPSAYPELATLRGDPSDNLIGAAGIGPVGAAKLLADYGSLEQILAHTGELTPAKAASLDEAADRLRRNLTLTRLVDDIPTVPEVVDMVWRPDIQQTRRLFSRLGFRSLMRLLNAATPE